MKNKHNIRHHIDEGDVFLQLSKNWHEEFGKKMPPSHHIDEGDIFVMESMDWHEDYSPIPHHMTEEEVILAMSLGKHH